MLTSRSELGEAMTRVYVLRHTGRNSLNSYNIACTRGLTGSDGVRYGPSDAVGDVGQERSDDGAHQRGERAADGQQQVDQVGYGLVVMVLRLVTAVMRFRLPAAGGRVNAAASHKCRGQID